MQIDLRVMELLSSRICHDLVSPVSAINNGVELIEDIGGDVVTEAMKLIGDSAQHAARRLRLFRMAYGRAGSEENLGARDVRQVVSQYIAAGKINLIWPDEIPADEFASCRGGLKTIANLIMLAEELLPYGGEVTLSSLDGETGCRLAILGRNAQLSPSIQAALEGSTPVEELTPRSVQAYITGKFADHFGLEISSEQPMVDRLEIVLTKSAENPSIENL